MTRSREPQHPTWVTSFAIGAVLLACVPVDGAGQDVACDVNLIGALQLPEITTSSAKSPLRVAPDGDARVAVTLPPDINVALLDQSDEWFVVGYQDSDMNRRLYVSTQDAEGPSQVSLAPRQLQAQEWAIAHGQACERVAGQRFAVRSLAAASVFAGLTSIIWHVYVEDDEHYGTGFGVWSSISVVSLVGAVYKGFSLSRAKKTLTEIGSPSFMNAGSLAGFGEVQADFRFDAAATRLAVVATWRP